MLTRLELEHFKCFSLLKLPLSGLTLLSGSNASGKSTVLQSLVLLHQTIREQEWSTRLLLNGTELQLGTITDVVNKVTGRRTFDISLFDAEESLHWTFESDRREMSARVVNVRVDGVDHENPEVLRFLLPPGSDATHDGLTRRLQRLCFLTAERIGPREVYALQDPSSTQVVGPRGEHAASILNWNRDVEVVPALALADTPPTLLHQVEARMNRLFPGCSLELQQIPQSNSVTLGFRTAADTGFHRPVHVGFGLTQALPIVIAALSRQPGDFLLIENPEVHLHPAGQSMMGAFLALVAAAGIQVFIESHSDHVLNGIRRSVKSGVIAPDDVLMHFFRQVAGDEPQVVSPIVDRSGNIDVWPAGFFDQFDKDMNYFAGWGE